MDEQKVDNGTKMDGLLYKKCLECIKCPLCDNVLRRPKLLPCNHDICQVCLNKHIIRTVPMSGYDIYEYTTEDVPKIKPTQKTFVCPVVHCDIEIRPPNPSKPTFEWAGQFENNLKLLSVLNLCSDRCSNCPASCDNCRNMLWNIQAKCVCFTCKEKMCLKCEILHKELYPDHIFCDVSTLCVLFKEVASSQEGFRVSKSVSKKNQSDHPFQICKIHKPFPVDMICLNCVEEGCEICCVKRHHDCIEKVELNTLGETMNFDEVATVTREMFETSYEKCLARLAEFLSMLETLKMGPCKMKKDVYDNKGNSNEDPAPKSNADKSPEELVLQLSFQISRCEYLIEKVQENLSGLSTHGSKDNCGTYSACQILKCQNMFEMIDSQINETEKSVIEMRKMGQSYFQNTAECSEIKENNEDCAVLEIDMWQNKTKRIPDESESVHPLKMLNVKSYSDMSDCWLTDCTFLNEQGIVVTDNANMKLKFVTLEGMLQEITLVEKPWGVSSDDNNKVYVTLPDLCSIQVFEIGNRYSSFTGLRATTAFTTKTKCYGISVVESKVVISLRNGSQESLMILNECGIELKEIPLQASVKMKYICATIDEDMIKVVLSSRSNEIVQVNIKQCNLQNYVASEPESKLFCEYPTGLDIDNNGNVLFCSNNTGEIQCFYDTEDTKETLLIRGLSLPRALSFSKQLRQIVVTVDSGNKQNCVLVYAVK